MQIYRRHSISHVLFLCTQTAYASYSGGNHLSTGGCLSLPPFSSFGRTPLPEFGFLARGVYPFHPHRFRCDYVTVALFRESLPYPGGLRHYSRRQTRKDLPRLMTSPGTNTTVISEPCEHGLSSTTRSCSDYLNGDFGNVHHTINAPRNQQETGFCLSPIRGASLNSVAQFISEYVAFQIRQSLQDVEIRRTCLLRRRCG